MPPSSAATTPASVRQWRLSTRLVRGVIGVVIGCLAIVVLLTGAFTKFEITERLDDSLQEVAERLQFAVLVLNQQGSGHDVAHLSNIMPTSLAYQITDAQGHVLLRSSNAPESGFVTPPQAGFFMQHRFRVYVTPAAQPDRFIMVGEPRVHRAQATHHAILIAVLPILGAIPCIWLLVVWIVRRSLRPLVRLQGEIRERGSGNLNPVPQLDLPVELSTIQAAVNLLLERLHKALAAERAFAGNAAHELRNPIAALLAQAQMLRGQLARQASTATLPLPVNTKGQIAPATMPADTLSPAGTSTSVMPQTALSASEKAEQTAVEGATYRLDAMISQIQRLSRIVEKLLQLSRAVAGTGFRRDKFDLLPVLHVMADELDRPQNSDNPRLMLETGCCTHLSVRGDMDATGILLRNVLENALRHSPPDSPVRVSLALADSPMGKDIISRTQAQGATGSSLAALRQQPEMADAVILTVENASPALPDATLSKLTDPFVRGGSQAEGSGLGLAIARTIARHMNVPMQLASPIPGQKDGFMVQLIFPQDAA